MTSKDPCTRRCFLNLEEGYCTGCFRDIQDTCDWWRKSKAEKQKALDKAEKRRRGLGGQPAG